MFSGEKKLEKQLKQVERDNRRAQRELERDRNQLQNNETRIKDEIKRCAAQGNKEACAILAKQLVKNRQQVTRSYEMSARMKGVAAQQSLMKSNMILGDAAKKSTDIMSRMNKRFNNAETTKVLKKFSKQNMKMAATEEAMDDILANVFEDNEEEEDAVVKQVLDELGIETTSKLAGAPVPSKDPVGTHVAGKDTEDIEAQLARLRDL